MLVGVTHTDDAGTAAALARKVHELRILAGERSAAEVGAPLLVVSQFTLYADTRKGRRPSWSAAAPGPVAEPLVDAVVAALRERGATVATGVFGALMQVALVNDGPVTVILRGLAPPPAGGRTVRGVDESLAIGRFARLSGLTVKALRHYDEIGLLPPAAVDPVTRHRRYAPAQLDRARRIHRLRSLDLPLAEIRAVLAAPDGGRARLTAYRRDVQARVTRDQRILHGLTHLLEGDDMTDTARTDRELPAEQRRQLAADLFNLVWELLERPGRSADEDDRMVHAAHASRYHWGEVGGPEQRAIGEWQCARVYSVLGRAEPALHHAQRCAGIARANDVPAWLLASAHEGLARAHAVAGNHDEARRERDLAHSALAKVQDAEEREVVEADLAGIALR